jgi:hypothetical protein
MGRFNVREVLVTAVLLTAISVPVAADPVAWWDFERGQDRLVTDRASGTRDEVLGFFKYVQGSSGDALRFDGYSTVVRRKADKTPNLGNSFSFEAWVAFQAYPWGLCSIVSQCDAEDASYAKKRPAQSFPPEKDPSAGYYFAVDARGRVHLQVSVGGEWIRCQSEARVPLLEWAHIAGTYDSLEGLVVYVNGEKAGSTPTSGVVKFASDIDLLIGRNHNKRRVENSIISVIPAMYSFDGYIDEVKVYNRTLDPDEIAKTHEATKSPGGTGMAYRKLPTEPRGPAPFGAYYTKLKFHETWDAIWRADAHPDVVVLFDDMPGRFVSWRGTGYVPFWVTENDIWYTNEFNESWPPGDKAHICEPMSDKQARYSHVRIIENSDARVVIHWRYALTNTDYEIAYADPLTGWGDWADEYDYIYPDGLALRKQRVWSSRLDQPHEFQESIVLSQPGTRPEDNIELDAVTIVNMKGETYTYSWADGLPGPPPGPDTGPPSNPEPGVADQEDDFLAPFIKLSFPNIQLVNTKSRVKPFLIVSDGPYKENWPFGHDVEGPVNIPYTGFMLPDVCTFTWWNHWPVAQVPSDARWALDPDRVAHTSVSNVFYGVYEATENSKIKLSMQGLTEKTAEELVPLAKSWLHAATLKLKGSGYSSMGYDQTERAYQLKCKNNNESEPLRFELLAGEEHPVVNPAFVITGWGDRDVALKINGRSIERGKNFRFGFRHNPDSIDLIVWVKKEIMETTELTLSPDLR